MVKLTTVPTSIRLSPAEKRQIAAAASKAGVSPAKFIATAALRAASPLGGAEQALAAELVATTRRHLARLEAEQDKLDADAAAAAWEHHVKNKTRLFTAEEAKRELGL